MICLDSSQADFWTFGVLSRLHKRLQSGDTKPGESSINNMCSLYTWLFTNGCQCVSLV